MHTSRNLLRLLVVTSATACNVESTSPDAQGVQVSHGNLGPDAGVDAGHASDAGDAGPTQATPPGARGFYVIHSDYSTSTVSAVDLSGEVLAETLLSSGSKPPGLSLALGADAIAPRQVQAGDELVLIDRTNQALHWLELETGTVTHQVNVGPGGFAANPYDYVQVSPELGFVARFETNAAPGQEDFDEGGDLLALNPETGELLGRVDFNALTAETKGLQPRPSSIVMHDGALYVVLSVLDANWTALADSMLVKVDPQQMSIEDTLDLGLRNCEDATLAPSGTQLAVGCKGDWQDDPVTKMSGIVVVSIAGGGLELEHTYPALELANAQINGVSYAAEALLAFTAYGSDEQAERALVLDLKTGETRDEPLAEAAPYSLGTIRCLPEQHVCALANAEQNAIELYVVKDNAVTSLTSVAIDDGVGLPPRYIGAF